MGPAQSAIKGGDVAVYDSFAVKSPCGGIDAPITARAVGLPPRGGKYFLSKRKYQREHAARRLRRRPTSLGTAAKPCAALGLGYALHGFQPFLALVGLRSAGVERLDDPNKFGSSNSGLRAGTV